MQIIISGGNVFYEGKLQGRLLPEEEFVLLRAEEVPVQVQNYCLHIFSFELANDSGFDIDFGINGHYWQFNERPYRTREEAIDRFRDIDSHLLDGTFHLRKKPSNDLSLVLD